MAIILGATAALARVGLAPLARVTFVMSGVLAAAYYIRRSPWSYLTITLWFWTFTALARRIIDYNSSFDAVNFVLATPNIMALFMLKDVLKSRDLLRHPESFSGVLLLLPVVYGLVVNLCQGDVVPGLVGSADWFTPILYFFFFIANWRHIDEAAKPFGDFIAVNGLLVVTYGLVQYFQPSPWDVAWVLNSGLTTIGKPDAEALRVFGTLNAAGHLAVWLCTLILLSLHFRTRLSALLMPAAALLLMLTLCRSVVGALLFGFVVAGCVGRPATFKVLGGLLIGLILVGLIANIYDPGMTDRLSERFDTIDSLGSDTSALARESIYDSAISRIDDNPLGLGIGAIGRGAVAAQSSDLVTIDSGPLEIYLALGWVAGSVYLMGIVLAVAQALISARATRSQEAVVLAASATAGASVILFMNIIGFFGVLVWMCAAYAAAIGIKARDARR